MDILKSVVEKHHTKDIKLRKREKEKKEIHDYNIEQKAEKRQTFKKAHHLLQQELAQRNDELRKKNSKLDQAQKRLQDSTIDHVASKREDKEIKLAE